MWYVLVVQGLTAKDISVVRVVEQQSIPMLPQYFPTNEPRLSASYMVLTPQQLAQPCLYIDFYECGADTVIPQLRGKASDKLARQLIQTAKIVYQRAGAARGEHPACVEII